MYIEVFFSILVALLYFYLLRIYLTYIRVKFIFLLYISISFDKCIQLFEHHQHQDTEEFHYPQIFSHAAFHSQSLWESPAPGRR